MNTSRRRQRGFSLVDTLVGLTVGLVVAATAMGTASFMEGRTRVSIGSNSVLVNGALGLGPIDNEVRNAGLGIMSRQQFACPSFNINYKGTVRSDGVALYPAMIVAGDGAADTLSVVYLDSLTSATYAQVLLPMTKDDADLKVALAPDATVGAVLLLQDTLSTSPCTVRDVVTRSSTDFGTNLTIAAGTFKGNGFTNPVLYSENSHAYASRRFAWTTFRVKNNTLEEVDKLSDTSTVIADGVIGLKAQYGITDGSTATVSSWVNATGTWATPAASDMTRVRAIRIGLVLRSQERDSSCAGTTSTWAYWPGGPTLDVSANTDWKCYSYRTFHQIIPMINVVTGLK